MIRIVKIALILILTMAIVGCSSLSNDLALTKTKEITPNANYYVLQDDEDSVSILVETLEGRRYLYVYEPQFQNIIAHTPSIYTFVVTEIKKEETK